jgi:hypothetical protein
LFNFHTSQLVWEEIDNQRVDHFVLSPWLVNYAIMSQPMGEIRISRYFSRKNVTFHKNPSSGILSLLHHCFKNIPWRVWRQLKYTSVTSLHVDLRKWKTAIYFVKLVRKRIKQIFFSGSLEKQSLTLFPVYYDNFSNLDS